jgi:hypothetical protein
MSTNYIPGTEAGLVDFSDNFKTKITASPTTYSLTALQATSYGTKHDAFVAARTLAIDPATRSPMNVELKDVAKRTLISEIRLLSGIVQNAPTTTNAMRIDLRLTQRGNEPTPVPPPSMAPIINLVSVNGRIVRYRISDAQHPTSRARPWNADGVTIFSYVGTMPPPAGDPGWKWEGQTGRRLVEVQFPNDVAAGTPVWDGTPGVAKSRRRRRR